MKLNRIIAVPDSFKGTMTSAQVCETVKSAVLSVIPGCTVDTIPVADGGEGSVDCFLAALGGERVSCTVKGPFFQDMTAVYGILPDGTAVIELASCAGLSAAGDRRDPSAATTYGAGQLLADAAARGCRKMIMCLGGSATNDCGAGAACAAGVRFTDFSGRSFIPTGRTLKNVAAIDTGGLDPRVAAAEITTMCDIDNPLFGPDGAACVFAPQKGADGEMVRMLDDGLRSISSVISASLGKDVSALPGAGAAGGMGAGMNAFFSSALRSGISAALSVSRFDELLDGADLVITGEGKLDGQSLRGKAVSGVAAAAKRKNVPVVAVCGGCGRDLDGIYETGVSAVFTACRLPEPLCESAPFSREDLFFTVENIIRALII